MTIEHMNLSMEELLQMKLEYHQKQITLHSLEVKKLMKIRELWQSSDISGVKINLIDSSTKGTINEDELDKDRLKKKLEEFSVEKGTYFSVNEFMKKYFPGIIKKTPIGQKISKKIANSLMLINKTGHLKKKEFLGYREKAYFYATHNIVPADLSEDDFIKTII